MSTTRCYRPCRSLLLSETSSGGVVVATLTNLWLHTLCVMHQEVTDYRPSHVAAAQRSSWAVLWRRRQPSWCCGLKSPYPQQPHNFSFDSSPGRSLLLSGDFYLGGVVAATLAKLVLRLRTLNSATPASVNRTAAQAMLVGDQVGEAVTCICITS